MSKINYSNFDKPDVKFYRSLVPCNHLLRTWQNVKAVAIDPVLPRSCSSGPMVVMRAERHLPRHWTTSTWEGGMTMSNVTTKFRVGSTYERNKGPPESAIKDNACKAHT